MNTIRKWKCKPQIEGKTFATYMLMMKLYPEHSSSQKMVWEWPVSYMEKMLNIISHCGKQTKPAVANHYTSIRLAKTKNTDNSKF